MIDFPNWFAGTVTIVALVGLGIFLYPWLMRQKGGHSAVGAITVVLTFVFYLFDRSMDTPIVTSWLMATLWAAAPAGVALFLHRMYRRSHPAGADDGAAST
jgi:hypothetical protein